MKILSIFLVSHAAMYEGRNLLQSVPGAKDNSKAGIRGARLNFESKDLRKCFDEVIGNVISLAADQVEIVARVSGSRNVHAIVVVGGFGECHYLQKQLRQTSVLDGIPILVPPNA